jgi:hypothetical protein
MNDLSEGTPKFQQVCKVTCRSVEKDLHDPVLISYMGNLALYGCHGCTRTFEVWDAPRPHTGGSMLKGTCKP